MPANLEDVREWMAEGDRLMAQAYDYLDVGTDDPLQLDLAGRHFSRAAQAYLAGGVEYQHGPEPAVQAGAVSDDPAARLAGYARFARSHRWILARSKRIRIPLPRQNSPQRACERCARRMRMRTLRCMRRYRHAPPASGRSGQTKTCPGQLMPRADFACCASAPNAAVSCTAMSASTLRSISTPALLRPFMMRL